MSDLNPWLAWLGPAAELVKNQRAGISDDNVGLKVEKPSDVEGALREAIRLKDRTVFLDIRTDPTENVWPMVQAGKGISEMLLGSEDL